MQKNIKNNQIISTAVVPAIINEIEKKSNG